VVSAVGTRHLTITSRNVPDFYVNLLGHLLQGDENPDTRERLLKLFAADYAGQITYDRTVGVSRRQRVTQLSPVLQERIEYAFRCLSAARIYASVRPEKDVDGLHPFNQGRLLLGEDALRPCTPLGVMRLIAQTGLPIAGKKAVVIGRSMLVGKPVALMLLEQNATVTCCHSQTVDLAAEIQRADIVVAAIGQPEMIKGEWIKPGAIVIDVGISRMTDNKLKGDVEFATAKEHAAFITPVPGGVGPMTVAMLLANTLKAAERQAKKE